ncbi:hypothetical protein HMPREF3038_01173 [Akkermansia sp. KLE1797]|nr:hypothetical protein HMPREF3038_01173 [Akkermansia sp. KLE1797]KXU53309.1 hypothetical protein HMPREF3039_02491 [Akkermansia sp. KLE1798]KZA05155.1 hypothetical protein HMPREF1326_01191 [Akkermansia sp. KLE1605]
MVQRRASVITGCPALYSKLPEQAVILPPSSPGRNKTQDESIRNR